MIPFNKAPVVGSEIEFIGQALQSRKLCGDGPFSNRAEQELEIISGCKKALLTPSCTAALEMAALLIELKEGDEVIMPSYTFVSTANAFALRGARIVFVDADANTMNIDANLIESAITPRTKAIVAVHYAGVACDMATIMRLSEEHKLYVIEDAAQAIDSYFNGKPLGSIGHLGTYSFHETKNITSGGEGGALLINDIALKDRAEIIREKGTNRSQFFRGQVDKYSWVDIGSSYLPSEVQGAYLYGQLLELSRINDDRRKTWNYYYNALEELKQHGVNLPLIPDYATNNAHMFYLKCKTFSERCDLIKHLRSHEISAVFHYVPLHSSVAGKKFGTFHGADIITTAHSERLLRLPLYFGMKETESKYVAETVLSYYNNP